MLWYKSPELWKAHAGGTASLIEELVLFEGFGLWGLEVREWFHAMFGEEDVVIIAGIEVSGWFYSCHVFLTLICS